MPKLPVCPEVSELQQLAVGQIPPPELDALVHHLEVCPNCFDKLKALSPADTLVDVLGKVKLLAQEPEEEAVSRVIERLTPAPAAPGQPEASKADTLAGLLFDDDTDARDEGSEHWAFLAPPQQPDEIGRLGPYRVLRLLGRGGMGLVFEAEDPALQRRVALKVMLPLLAAIPTAKKRFLREARAAAAIRHQNVVHVYAVEEAPIPYLVMELVPGETLQQRLDRAGPWRSPTFFRSAGRSPRGWPLPMLPG